MRRLRARSSLLGHAGIACLAMLYPFAATATDSAASETDDTADSHWSGLPIWGEEATARGYRLPLPFGLGITGYSGEQPVAIHDLRLGLAGAPPVSVSDVLQIDRVDTTQQNVSAKFDVLVLPFLDVYVVAGRTQGTTKGVIEVASASLPGFDEARQLRLDAAFDGPTYGAGATLQGGMRLGDWHELTGIVVLDWNRTRTDLEFENQSLVAETKPQATVLSARLGLHARIGETMHGAAWIGGMRQQIQQTVAGRVAGTDLQFMVVQAAAKPWNTLLGGLLEIGDGGSHVLVEGGFGARKSVLVAATLRF